MATASGDDGLDNAVKATDASVLINNILVTSASNTLTSVIAGATLTVLKKDTTATIGIDVAADTSALRTRLNTFVAAYNSLNAFTAAQKTAAGNGDPASIGRDPLLSAASRVAQIVTEHAVRCRRGVYLSVAARRGVHAERHAAGEQHAVRLRHPERGRELAKLFVGTSETPGAFASINTLMTEYTQTSGLLASSQAQRASQVSRLTDQISSMQDRLAVQRASLQREFAAADAAMTSLKNQSGALASFGATTASTAPTSSAS